MWRMSVWDPDNEPIKKDKWIPCSEKLPQNNKLVLCTEKGTKQLYIGWHTTYEDEDIDRWSDTEGFSMDVVAWMPLPEPYVENNH